MRFTHYLVIAASCFLLLALIPGGSAEPGKKVSLATRVKKLEARVKKLEEQQIALRTLICLQVTTC